MGVRSKKVSRRDVVAGMASLAGSAALADAPARSERPLPRGTTPVARVPNSQSLIDRAGLGGVVGFAVLDMGTGEVLETALPDTKLPPASTLKAVTSLYAMERLGSGHRFRTEVLVDGLVIDGRLEGDLILAGGGDPTLDTDRLADLAAAMRDTGLREVTGRFLVWRDALPFGERIDDEQPDHVGYNPAVSGLNLNFNRVHFQWERQGDGYGITMEARAIRFSPATSIAHMAIVDRTSPVFAYRRLTSRDTWTVSRKALGNEGSRWLPVRFPALYCGDVFRTLARFNGIELPAPEIVTTAPGVGMRVLVSTESQRLRQIVSDMMKYSTNLTAEAVGLSASMSNGVPVNSLLSSGSRMAGWSMENFGADGLRFRDHSGLGYGSAVTPVALARILQRNPQARPLMKSVNLGLGASRPAPANVTSDAKTGTLNFVSTLAGYVTCPSGRELSYSILTADVERRDAIPPSERERPRGARSWSNRSRQLQKELIRSWASRFDKT